jgi:hypothetical protein
MPPVGGRRRSASRGPGRAVGLESRLGLTGTVFFAVFLRPVDNFSVLPRKRICHTKKIEGDNITGRLWAVWAEI